MSRQRPGATRVVTVAGEKVRTRRVGLRYFEAAFVAREPERDVKNRIRRGDLEWVPGGRNRCVEPQALADLIAGDPLACEVYRGILEGRVVAPKAPHPSMQPPELVEVVRSL